MTNNSRIHFFYIVGMLVAVIVLVMTEKWSERENFTEFLTNAATLTSLVLGVVAIFYSFVANDGLSRSLGNIAKVSDDITATRTSLTSVIEQSERLIAGSDVNARDLKEISLTLDTRISSLRDAMSQFQTQSDLMKESIGVIPARFDQLEAKLSESSATAVKVTESFTSQSAIDGLVQLFLKQSTLASVFALYGAVMAKAKEIDLDLVKYHEAIGMSSAAYLHGTLMTLNATNLIDLGMGSTVRALHLKSVRNFSTLDNEAMAALVGTRIAKYTDTDKKRYLAAMASAQQFFSQESA